MQRAGSSDPQSIVGERVVLDALRGRVRDGAPTVWVFTGDSITQGAKHTHGQRSYVEHFHERVRWELRRTSDYVVNTGVSGSGVHDLAAAFAPRVARFSPDVVAVMLGATGIGAAVTHELLRRGARVAVVQRSEPELATALGETALVDLVVPIAADLSTAAGCRTAIRGAVDGLGGLDGLGGASWRSICWCSSAARRSAVRSSAASTNTSAHGPGCSSRVSFPDSRPCS